MKKTLTAFFAIAVFFLCTDAAQAYAPRIVRNSQTVITNPEMSQIFYGNAKDGNDVFEIDASAPFQLYVDLAVPDVDGVQKTVSAAVYTLEESPLQDGKSAQKKTTIAFLDGSKADWKKYDEPFAGDSYLKGPEFRSNIDGEPAKGVNLQPGRYFITVLSSGNNEKDSKYALMVGTKDEFSPKEFVKAVRILPELKMNYWGKSPLVVFYNMIGAILLGSAVAFLLLVFMFRKVWKKRKEKKMKIKIKKTDEEEDVFDLE